MIKESVIEVLTAVTPKFIDSGTEMAAGGGDAVPSNATAEMPELLCESLWKNVRVAIFSPPLDGLKVTVRAALLLPGTTSAVGAT